MVTGKTELIEGDLSRICSSAAQSSFDYRERHATGFSHPRPGSNEQASIRPQWLPPPRDSCSSVSARSNHPSYYPRQPIVERQKSAELWALSGLRHRCLPRRGKRGIARSIRRKNFFRRPLPDVADRGCQASRQSLPLRVTAAISSSAVWSRSGRAHVTSPQVRAGNADLLRCLANVPEMFRERSLDQSGIKIGATGEDHGRSTGQRHYLPNSLPNHPRSATNSPRCEAASSRDRRSSVRPGRGLRRGTALKKIPQAKYATGGPTRRAKRTFTAPHVPGDTIMPAQRLALKEP